MLKRITGYKKTPVLIIGDGKLAYSVSVCLLQAGHQVTLFTENEDSALKSINTHFSDLSKLTSEVPERANLRITNVLDDRLNYKLAIAVTNESLLEKQSVVHLLEKSIPNNAIIAINTESIPLSALQQNSISPERIIGTNWVEPAHTTYFLEIITNTETNKELADHLFHLAKACWNKDPYVIFNDFSIRAKMLSAMAREAFYLVQNGYASIEDVDRACRNDAGYYLPFAGNCRYMDLMGTYAYGLVMKDLNPELSKDHCLPEFLKEIIAGGGLGMENNKGFYNYEDGDTGRWNEIFRKFSYQIKQIIDRYPFNQSEESSPPGNKAKSVNP